MISERLRERDQHKHGKFDFGASVRWFESRVRHAASRGVLSPRDQALAERIKRLKREAGSHSPSAWTLAKLIPELRMKVDACFLSNPYATELFLDVLPPRGHPCGGSSAPPDLYPSQNRVIATSWAGSSNLEPDSLFVGNGAAEIIQAILHTVHYAERSW